MIKFGNVKKGDVIGMVWIVGIFVVKKIYELILFCYLLMIFKVSIDIELDDVLLGLVVIVIIKVSG